MNNLMSMNSEMKMTSLEIAELTGKMHKHILRDIKDEVEKLENGGIKAQPIFGLSEYKDSTGRKVPMYTLTREGVLQLAARYDAVTRYRLIEMANKTNQTQVQLPSYQIEDPIERANVWIKEQKEKQMLQLENAQKEQIITEMKPKASYYDLILQNKGLMPITTIAKDYGMTGANFNTLLHELKIQYKQGKTWLLYQNYAEQGYTQSKTYGLKNGYNVFNTQWTQKGRLFIYDLLKNKRGIVPVMERDEVEIEVEDKYNGYFDDDSDDTWLDTLGD
jgi:Rha family phage regulatory protein